MRIPTPEITAFCAFWAVKTKSEDHLLENVEGLAKKLASLAEHDRHVECTKFILLSKNANEPVVL
jgi:hypothetical protein